MQPDEEDGEGVEQPGRGVVAQVLAEDGAVGERELQVTGQQAGVERFTVLVDGPVDGTILPGRRYPSAISVGTNPTFGDSARSVEAFVLDESADLYGRLAAVDFVDHVRDMVKFASVDELLVAMDRDVTTTRTVLGADADRP